MKGVIYQESCCGCGWQPALKYTPTLLPTRAARFLQPLSFQQTEFQCEPPPLQRLTRGIHKAGRGGSPVKHYRMHQTSTLCWQGFAGLIDQDTTKVLLGCSVSSCQKETVKDKSNSADWFTAVYQVDPTHN